MKTKQTLDVHSKESGVLALGSAALAGSRP